jgi:hypothetical protein
VEEPDAGAGGVGRGSWVGGRVTGAIAPALAGVTERAGRFQSEKTPEAGAWPSLCSHTSRIERSLFFADLDLFPGRE